MNTSEIIRTMMKEKGYTYRSLAEKLGYSTPSAISQRLKTNITVEVFLRFLEAMDCELRVYSKGDDGLEFLVEGK